MSCSAIYFAGAVAAALMATALLVWALFSDRSRGRKRCPKCWYDMSAAVALRCPECGHEARHERRLLKTRRRWKAAVAALLPFALAGYLAIQPKVQRDGWWSVMPTTLMLLYFQFQQDAAVIEAMEMRFSTEHYIPVTFRVPIEEMMYRWQWRWLSRRTISLLARNDLPAAHRDKYIAWASSLRGFVEDDALSTRLLNAVTQYYGHEDPRVRGSAAMFSVDEGNPEDTVARLLPLLSDPDPSTRKAAVTALGLLVYSTGSEAAIAKLIESLDDNAGEVRVSAAFALYSAAKYSGIRSPAAKTALHAAFARAEGGGGGGGDFQGWLVRAMAEYEHESDRSTFVRRMLAHHDPHVRGGAFDVLSMTQMDRHEFIDAAVRELLNPEASTSGRWSAGWIVQNCRCPERLMPHEADLRELARHDDEHTRRAAYDALIGMGLEIEWYQLTASADDDDSP